MTERLVVSADAFDRLQADLDAPPRVIEPLRAVTLRHRKDRPMLRDDLVTTDLPVLAARLKFEVGEILRTLAGPAGPAQYERAPIPSLVDDTTERAKGGHGDPTPGIVVDTRRLALRAAIIAAEREIASAVDALAKARADVDAAFARWEGEG